ncbi:MAG: DUF2605 domain-containing protein [Chroococcales cyanobacterium]
MLPSDFTEKELLKTVLEPLLQDFQYWFDQSRSFLESERIPFFTPEEQSQLLEKVKQAQQEVSTAQLLFKATGEQVGIAPETLIPWHQLVTECWQVAMRWRSFNHSDRAS